MSDNLKNFFHIPSFVFSDGGLPEATVFNNLFVAVRQGFADAQNLLGPLVRSGALLENKNYLVSMSTWDKMGNINQGQWRAARFNNVTNTFNLARILGPHAALNPSYIPGSIHLKAEQGVGWPLRSDVLEQELPFYPISGGTFALSSSTTWLKRATQAEVYSDSAPSYYIDIARRRLFSNKYFDGGESLKYDLRISNEESYFGSGYNIIPDPSILTMNDAARLAEVGTGSDYGAVKVELVSTSNDSSYWKLTLPKVISVKESLLAYGTSYTRITSSGFLPVGKYHAGTSSKRYYINPAIGSSSDGFLNNPIYSGTFLEENLVCLYDSATSTTYQGKVERDSNSAYWHVLYITLPYDVVNQIKNDAGNLIVNNLGSFNTKSFFLFLSQTNMAEKLAQIAMNYQAHTHDGKDSHGISHKDLLQVDSEMPVVGDGDGGQGGLNIHEYARRFFTSKVPGLGSLVPNEVHPQYLNKYGYLYGGSQGLYSKKLYGYNTPRNMNLFHGDFVFSPIANDSKSYMYESALSSQSDKESITWNLTTPPSSMMRGHALIFGIPQESVLEGEKIYVLGGDYNISGTGLALNLTITIPTNHVSETYPTPVVTVPVYNFGYDVGDRIMFRGNRLGGNTPTNDLIVEIETVVDGVATEVSVVSGTYAFHHSEEYSEVGGAVKLYYEPSIFQSHLNEENVTLYDKTGTTWNLARHGFIPGNVTNDEVNGCRGLNIGWGNLFFGYREDIFNGRLKENNPYTEAASAHWRVSEFNILATANKVAGSNTNSNLKSGSQYRDGFAVKAIQGANIWLNVGGYEAGLQVASDPANGKTVNGVPGTIAIEATYPANSIGNGTNTLKTRISADATGTKIASGAGFFSSPGPVVDRDNNKFLNPWSYGLVDHKFAGLWNDDVVLGYPTDTGNLAGAVSGGFLDNEGFGPGPILDIFNLAPDRQKSLPDVQGLIGKGTDISLTGWVFGRPFLRGTYGVNFCLDGDFSNLHPDFKTGYHTKIANSTWGPSAAILDSSSTNNQYIHREFRFWGKNSSGPAVSWNSNSTSNTVGGNINLLYNFGRDYLRFGQNIPWSNVLSVNGNITASPWSNSRRIALGSSTPEDYGSAIRQASFVEAFSGFRSDPLQPYTAEYVIPFKVKYLLGETSLFGSGYNRIEEKLAQRTFCLTHDDLVDSAKFTNTSPVRYTFVTPGNPDASLKTSDIFIDHIVRGAEDLLIQKSGPGFTLSNFGIFPASLQNVKVDLEYFIGQNLGSTAVTGDLASPSYTNASSSSSEGFLLNDGQASITKFQYLDGTGLFLRRLRTTFSQDPLENDASQYVELPGSINAFDGGLDWDSESTSAFNAAYKYRYGADYKNVLNGTVIMVEAYKASINAAGTTNIIPTVMKGTGYTPALDPFVTSEASFNGIVGYDAAIGVIPSTGSNNTYYNKFANFNQNYSAYMDNKMFCLMINFGRKLDNLRNSPVPYRVYKGDEYGSDTAGPRVYNITSQKGFAATVTIYIGPSSPYANIATVVITNPGSGYSASEGITIPGASLGGLTSANNMFLTVTEVNGSGGVTDFTVSGVSADSFASNEGLDYLWVEFRGRVTLKTITAYERAYPGLIN